MSSNVITPEWLDQAIARMYRVRRPVASSKPKETVDFSLLYKHGIGHYRESAELVIFSSEGLRRAREVGAIVPVD